jgi:hypothetical protein
MTFISLCSSTACLTQHAGSSSRKNAHAGLVRHAALIVTSEPDVMLGLPQSHVHALKFIDQGFALPSDRIVYN